MRRVLVLLRGGRSRGRRRLGSLIRPAAEIPAEPLGHLLFIRLEPRFEQCFQRVCVRLGILRRGAVDDKLRRGDGTAEIVFGPRLQQLRVDRPLQDPAVGFENILPDGTLRVALRESGGVARARGLAQNDLVHRRLEVFEQAEIGLAGAGRIQQLELYVFRENSAARRAEIADQPFDEIFLPLECRFVDLRGDERHAVPFDEREQVFLPDRFETVKPGEWTDQAAPRRVSAVKPHAVKNDPFRVDLDAARVVARHQARRVAVHKREMLLPDVVKTGEASARLPEDFADREPRQQRAEQILEQILECVAPVAAAGAQGGLQLLRRHPGRFGVIARLQPPAAADHGVFTG